MRKSELSEQDIRTKFITPAILDTGWDRDRQLRNMVYFANYKIIAQADTECPEILDIPFIYSSKQ